MFTSDKLPTTILIGTFLTTPFLTNINCKIGSFKRLIIPAFVAVTFGLVSPHNNIAAATDWVRVDACHISFLLPRDLKRSNREGIDSCIAEFANRKMELSVDYGWYGGRARKDEVTLEFKEKNISVDGKTAQLATYIDDSLYARKNPNRKYVAHLYVVVRPSESERAPMTTSLMITVRGKSKNVEDVAERIFRSVRFQ
jgi:hypothetical protein